MLEHNPFGDRMSRLYEVSAPECPIINRLAHSEPDCLCRVRIEPNRGRLKCAQPETLGGSAYNHLTQVSDIRLGAGHEIRNAEDIDVEKESIGEKSPFHNPVLSVNACSRHVDYAAYLA